MIPDPDDTTTEEPTEEPTEELTEEPTGRLLSDELRAHFGEETTSLATCWRIERTDGFVVGFTSLDQPLVIDGLEYSPISGQATAFEQTLGTEADNMDVSLVFDDERITPDDMRAGLWDYASFFVFMVNYNDLTQGKLLTVRGTVGQVSIEDDAKGTAEFLSLTDNLKQNIGRVYTSSCDVKSLGDERCGVDVTQYTFSGSVSSVVSLVSFTSDISGVAKTAGYFRYGMLTWTSGANAGKSMEVIDHQYDTTATFVLFQPMPADMAEGDTFEVVAGCDRTFATCKSKFNNVRNFRGFPHIPGRDEGLKYGS
jgi:uncharacterized phage protein (TIGR02218 family)